MTPRPSMGYRFAAAFALATMAAQRWQFAVSGADHVPRHGGAVLVANHIGYWDFITVAREPYRTRKRPVRILAKDGLFTLPVAGRIMRSAGHIPVRRGAGRVAFRAAVTALRDGELVLVLPEQTISPSYELLPFKFGAVRMAQAANVPLLPAASWGSHRFATLGRRPRWSWRLPVSVAYGAPMHLAATEDVRSATVILQQRVAALLAGLQAAYADGAPLGAWWVPARLGGGAPTHDDALAALEQLTKGWTDA